MTVKVLLDTNFLFIPLRFNVDIFGEFERILDYYRPVVTTPVLEELETLHETAKPSLKKKVKFALKLANECDIINVDLQEGETVDHHLVRIAKKLNGIVATTDGELRSIARDEGIPVVYLRQRAYLEIEGKFH
ncbi:MAG: PIN domain-containing protein [Candidatus Bathyarchaeia archaeon]